MKNNLLKKVLCATLLLSAGDNVSYTMENENNSVDYYNIENQQIKQKVQNQYRDELNKWDETFECSLNKIEGELIEFATEIDTMIEESGIVIEEQYYKNSNNFQNFEIYKKYIQRIESLIVLDQVNKVSIQELDSNNRFNALIPSTHKYLNLSNKKIELFKQIQSANESLYQIQCNLNKIQYNDKTNSNEELQEKNNLEEKYNKLQIKIENMQKEYQEIDNKLKTEHASYEKMNEQQKLEESVFENILDEYYQNHINAHTKFLEQYGKQIQEYCNKLAYALPLIANSQYKSDIKNWIFNNSDN